MDTPICAGAYEAGHSDCDGDASGGACKLRKPCIALSKFAWIEKFEPSRLASALSVKEIKAFCAGRLELKAIAGRHGKQLHKSINQKRAPKPPPIFRMTHWKLYHEFEKAMVEHFQHRRVVNRLVQRIRYMKEVRIPDRGRKAVLRKGALYPIVKTREDYIEQVMWCYTNACQADTYLVKIVPLNKPTRLFIQMQFPIAELELRMAPEMIAQFGIKTQKRMGVALRTLFKIRTASVELIRLSVHALKIMVDSGYLGVPEFGALKGDG